MFAFLFIKQLFQRIGWGTILFLVACAGGVQGGANPGSLSGPAPGNPTAQAPGADPIQEAGGGLDGMLPTASNQYAMAPTQGSGAPSPGFDPNGNISFLFTLDFGKFNDSPTNGIGMVAAKLYGWIDTSEVKGPNGELLDVDLSYHVLRFVDPEEKTYVDTHLKTVSDKQFAFEAFFLMTPERFQQLSQQFGLELSLSSLPTRSQQVQLFPLTCPEDACGLHLPAKYQWTKWNAVGNPTVQ